MAALPSATTEEAFAAIRRDEAVLRPAVEQLCQLLGVNAAVLTRYPVGSRPVYTADDLVLKLFPPVTTWPDYRIEAQVLPTLAGQLPTPTPQVHAVGEHDRWGYVLMSRLPGVPLDTVWDQVPAQDRDLLASQLGETIAALHRIQPPAIKNWWPADWPAFVARQRAQCVSRQRALGLPALWAEQIPGFLDAVAPPSDPPVLLHTELMRQHLLVTPDPWRLSGLIDFEPAMCGAREYEFAAVGVFLSEGDARFLRHMLLAYGYDQSQLDAALRRRFLAWLLLHRYSDLPWYFSRLPGPASPTLDALADCWFATG
ncbi:MAG TPA: aminoglycoside 3'-phosphotransferase/choline kinase family protein [Trebonia sp.]